VVDFEVLEAFGVVFELMMTVGYVVGGFSNEFGGLSCVVGLVFSGDCGLWLLLYDLDRAFRLVIMRL
jgi:hypothetical protein